MAFCYKSFVYYSVAMNVDNEVIGSLLEEMLRVKFSAVLFDYIVRIAICLLKEAKLP